MSYKELQDRIKEMKKEIKKLKKENDFLSERLSVADDVNAKPEQYKEYSPPPCSYRKRSEVPRA